MKIESKRYSKSKLRSIYRTPVDKIPEGALKFKAENEEEIKLEKFSEYDKFIALSLNGKLFVYD